MTPSFRHLPATESEVRERQGGDASVSAEQVERGQRRDHALKLSMISGASVRVLGAIVQLAILAILARSLEVWEFGVVATITSLLLFLSFADLGIGSGLITKLAMAEVNQHEDQAGELASSAWFMLWVLGGIVALCGIASTVIIPWSALLGVSPDHSHSLTSSVAAFFVCAGLAVPGTMGQRLLLARQKAHLASLWMLGGALAQLLTTILAARSAGSPWLFVVAVTGSPAICGMAQSIWVMERLYPEHRPRWRKVSVGAVKALVGTGGLFLALNVVVAISYQSDLMIIAASLGAGEAARYVIALKMFSAISGIISAASQQLWPAAAEALARGDNEWLASRYTMMLKATLWTSIPICLGVMLFGHWAAGVWVGPETSPPFSLFVWMGVWTVYSLVMAQIGLLLNAAQIVGPQVVMASAMAVANVSLSLLLVQKIGLAGPVAGSLLAHVCCSGVPAVILMRRILQRSGT